MTRLERAQSDQQGATGTYPSPSLVAPLTKQSVVAAAQPASEAKTVDQQNSKQAPPRSPGEIKEAAKQIESYLKSVGRELEFSIDDTTGRTVVTVKDSTTGDVVRQIPGEETLRLARTLGASPNALVDLEV